MCPPSKTGPGLGFGGDDVRDGGLPSGEKRVPGFLWRVVLHAEDVPSVEVGISDIARVEHAHRLVAPFGGTLVGVCASKQLPNHTLGGLLEQGFQEVEQFGLGPSVTFVVGGGRGCRLVVKD